MADSLATRGTLVDTETGDNGNDISEEEVAEEHTDTPKLTSNEADKAVTNLTTFLNFHEKVGHGFFKFQGTLVAASQPSLTLEG